MRPAAFRWVRRFRGTFLFPLLTGTATTSRSTTVTVPWPVTARAAAMFTATPSFPPERGRTGFGFIAHFLPVDGFPVEPLLLGRVPWAEPPRSDLPGPPLRPEPPPGLGRSGEFFPSPVLFPFPNPIYRPPFGGFVPMRTGPSGFGFGSGLGTGLGLDIFFVLSVLDFMCLASKPLLYTGKPCSSLSDIPVVPRKEPCRDEFSGEDLFQLRISIQRPL